MSPPPHLITDKQHTFQKPLDVTNHSVAREVVTFFTLPPGEYIVMPQTNVPNCDGKFLLRILTDEQSNIWSVDNFGLFPIFLLIISWSCALWIVIVNDL